MCVCVCARACDGGPRGRGRSGHREPQGLYDGGAVVRIPDVGAGCGLAGCQVPGGGEAAEGRGQRERVQPRCSGPGVASVGLACRNRRSRQVARRDDRWFPFPRRLVYKEKDGQGVKLCPLSFSCTPALPMGYGSNRPFSERWTRLPGTSFTCPARRERGGAVADGPAISAAQKPQHDNWPATEKVQGTAGRRSREG